MAPLAAQITELATTDDGARLFFSTPLRQRGTQQSSLPKVFVLDADGVRMVADAIGPSAVSGDGAVISYETGGDSVIVGPAGAASYPGRAALSRDGHSALLCGPSPALVDVESGGASAISGPAAECGGARRSVAADGALAFASADSIAVWRTGALSLYPTSAGAANVNIDDAAGVIVYQTAGAEPMRIMLMDPATGAERELYRGEGAAFEPRISASGDRVLFLAANAHGQIQAFVMATQGASLRQITSEDAGIMAATLSGDGRKAWASTGENRILEIDVETGETRERLPRSVVVHPPAAPTAPGSLVRLTGEGFGPEVSVTLSGAALPVISSTANELYFQVPWDAALGDAEVRVESPGASDFEGGPVTLAILALAPAFQRLVHEDLERPVTVDDPVRAGEIMHAYMTGLGTVEPEVSCHWVTEFGDARAEMMFAGLAEGEVGVHRVSVRLPEVIEGRLLSLTCGTAEAGIPVE